MNYKVNPVKATRMKGNIGIQEMNDTCFSICGAFSGTNNAYDMDPACSKSCADLIEQKKYEVYGVGSCDHQVPYRPVLWGQVPSFIPGLLRSGYDPDSALKICKEKCKNINNNLECIEVCDRDYNAIEGYVNTPKEQKMTLKGTSSASSNSNTVMYSLISVVFLILIIGIYVYYSKVI
jgi:hypothetical protein